MWQHQPVCEAFVVCGLSSCQTLYIYPVYRPINIITRTEHTQIETPFSPHGIFYTSLFTIHTCFSSVLLLSQSIPPISRKANLHSIKLNLFLFCPIPGTHGDMNLWLHPCLLLNWMRENRFARIQEIADGTKQEMTIIWLSTKLLFFQYNKCLLAAPWHV